MKKIDLVAAVKTAHFENSKEKMTEAIIAIAERVQALEAKPEAKPAAAKTK